MSLEELMKVKVTIASKKEMTQYDSPGIISVITAEEIQNSGASDLKDILRLVPGFEFAVDVTGAAGITLRGNLGYIGRVLIMLDGQELNELFYACTLVGNHYPVNNIKRIEIIRGPGSSIYGGFAELGVINIITKSGNDLDGIEIGVDYGQMAKTFSHKNISISAGHKINDFEYSIHGLLGKGNRSDRDNVDIYGDTFNMAGESDLNPMFINASAKYKGLHTRIIYDKYVIRTRDYFGVNLSHAYQIDYESILGEIKYDWQVKDNLIVTPKINFVSSVPWHSVETPLPEDIDSKLDFDKSATRVKFNLTGSYDISEDINIISGIEYFQDKAKHTKGFAHNHFWDGKNEINYNGMSGFIQGIFKTNFVNMTIGGRIDNHNQFGSAFGPRIGLTKVFNTSHFKLLYNHAFRTPSIDELDLNYYLLPSYKHEPELEPEYASVYEFEAGYNITSDMSLIANVFYSKVTNSIVFTYSDASEEGGEGYDNRGDSGSKGLELEYRLRKNWGYVTLNYSYYSAKDINEVAYYSPTDKKDLLLGTSPHKISLNSSFNIYKGLNINPSLIYLGKRYAYTHYDETLENMSFSVQNPLTLLNVYFNYKNLFGENINFGLGVYNLLDSEYDFIQPYNGSHPPLPGHSRKFVFKLSYNFSHN